MQEIDIEFSEPTEAELESRSIEDFNRLQKEEQFRTWMEHPYTKIFISFLKDKKNEFIEKASTLAASGNVIHQQSVILEMAKVNIIGQIICDSQILISK